MEVLGQLLLGMGNGAVYAALAVALVVTYRSSGVVNFASGSIALYGAYVYSLLREGELLVLVPGLPATIDLGTELGFWVACLIAVAMTSVLGLLLYLAVFRPLRTAPPVARVVASLGIQVGIVALIVKQLGVNPIVAEPIFPEGSVTVGDSVVQADRLWLAGTVVVLALALSAYFQFTRFGLITRAVAESEQGALVSRISPTKVAAINWMLSSAVAALAGILIAPVGTLVPIAYTLFIVPALAAAVIGRFQLLLPAVLSGLLIGMLQSETTFLQVEVSWFPTAGGPELVPLILILGALLVRSKPLPERGALIQRTLGRAPRPQGLAKPAVVGAAVGAALLLVLQDQWRSALVLGFIFSVIALSYVVITGYAGMISLAQLTLAGSSAYLLSLFAGDWGVPFPIAPLMSAAGAMVIGVVVGLPALRVRGFSVAVVTLALAVALDAAWFRNIEIVGTSGGVHVGPPELFGVDLGWGSGSNQLTFGFLVLGVLVAVAVGVAALRRSRLGSAMVAVRANERSAAAAGVDVVRTKMGAFAVGSFIAGLGGALLAYRFETISYDQFTPLMGLTLFSTAYLAGITSVSGGIVAGSMVTAGIAYLATHELLELGEWYSFLTAVLLVLNVIFNPEGITGAAHSLATRRAAARRAREGDGGAASPAGLDVETAGPTRREPAVDGTGRTLLRTGELTVRYGGVVALDSVSVDVPRGSIVGLIGPNGAGKTTMVDAICGFARSTGGVEFAGTDLAGRKPHERVRLGMVRTFQAIELYDDLSVQENLAVGLASGRHDRWGRDEGVRRTREVLGLDDIWERSAGELSQGQRQLVSIARALVGQPDLLILDEPAAGLDSTESQWLGGRLRRIAATGVTILMVEHDIGLVLSVCDAVHMLDFGRLVASGTPAEIRTNSRVIEAYLGDLELEVAR